MERKRYVVPEVTVTVARMDQTMSQTTRQEVLKKLRRRYQSAGPEHKRKLLAKPRSSWAILERRRSDPCALRPWSEVRGL